MTSVFDPKAFLNSTYDQGADTRFSLHQPGEFVGSVGVGEKDVDATSFKDKATGEERPIWNIWLTTDDTKARDPAFPEQDARVRHSLFIDLTADGKGLDFSPGKNRALGAFLMALGYQDKTGKLLRPWSPQMFKGARLRYRVEHEARKDTGEPQASVKAVAAV